MSRITVDISNDTYNYIADLRMQSGSSISFEANKLLEAAIKERNRKKKIPLPDGSKENNP